MNESFLARCQRLRNEPYRDCVKPTSNDSPARALRRLERKLIDSQIASLLSSRGSQCSTTIRLHTARATHGRAGKSIDTPARLRSTRRYLLTRVEKNRYWISRKP